AAATHRQALGARPDLPDALNGLARALLEIDEAEALEAIERAIKVMPGNIYAYDLLGTVLRRLGRFDESLDAYETALAIPGNHAQTYYGISRARKMSDADEALIARIQDELDRSEPSLSAWDRSFFHFALGKALDDLDRCEEAIRHFDLANALY